MKIPRVSALLKRKRGDDDGDGGSSGQKKKSKKKSKYAQAPIKPGSPLLEVLLS